MWVVLAENGPHRNQGSRGRAGKILIFSPLVESRADGLEVRWWCNKYVGGRQVICCIFMLPISNCGVIFYDIISLRAEAAAMICRFSQARARTMKHDFMESESSNGRVSDWPDGVTLHVGVSEGLNGMVWILTRLDRGKDGDNAWGVQGFWLNELLRWLSLWEIGDVKRIVTYFGHYGDLHGHLIQLKRKSERWEFEQQYHQILPPRTPIETNLRIPWRFSLTPLKKGSINTSRPNPFPCLWFPVVWGANYKCNPKNRLTQAKLIWEFCGDFPLSS